ncbi:vWA domain-containing protein [Shewanella goraebulensis]|uniref:vWA domain-containing protein n=1 Tax=Shewanella goraebulensis TaxID=3050637 RepID=UPI00254A56C0|nr:VWA domain-containing protein [Shewanella goraebulensis]
MDVWIIQMQHFHLLRPWWLLVIFPLGYIVYRLKQRQDNLVDWRKHMSPTILQTLTVNGDKQKFISPLNLTLVLGILSLLVLIGPTWQQQQSPFTEDKSALIIALDLSETMEQTDVLPTRLTRAKQKIIELLTIRGDANTALIAYTGTAHTVMPITNDSKMIKQFLDSLSYKIMPHSGKQPQSVLPLANVLLQATNTPGTILLITDGTSDDALNEFEQYFSQAQHQLIVWAIGRNNSESDEVGSIIIPMQFERLQTLAELADGRMILLSDDKQDVVEVNRYIDNNLAVSEDESRPWLDAGYWLVYLVAVLYLLWFRRGWTLQW